MLGAYGGGDGDARGEGRHREAMREFRSAARGEGSKGVRHLGRLAETPEEKEAASSRPSRSWSPGPG